MPLNMKDRTASCETPGLPREPIFRGDYIFNTGQIKHFSYLDYNFFVFTLFVSTFIGFYQAWRSRSNVGLDEYFLASRSMSAFPVSLSLMASFSSSLLIMGTSAEVYVFSTIYFWMGATYIVGTLIAAYTFIPIFYNLKITSVYEYLELRFSRSLRLACSSMYILAIIVYLSVVIYAPSTAIHAVTGLDLWGSIVTVGVVCTIYTAAGGMKAVIWTDVFQSAVTYTGILLMFIRSFMKVGSVSTVWESAKRTNRNRIFDFRLQSSLRHTVWSLMVGGSSIALTIASTQTQVMRCNACRSLHEATKAQFLQVIELMVIFYICMLIGMDLSSFYENCDPLKANLVDNPIQVMPLYMMDILGDTSGLPGLYLACLISATLSSISSGLNSVAAVITEDYIKVYFIPNLREKKSHTISQIVSVVFGTLCLEFTHIASKLEHLLQASTTIIEVLMSPVLGLFLLGMIFPMVTTEGAITGLVSSLVVMSWLLVGKYAHNFPPQEMALKCVSNCNITVFPNKSRNHLLHPDHREIEFDDPHSTFNLSYLWFSPLAILIVVAMGVTFSYLRGFQDPKSVDPRLIVPLVDVAFPFDCLSEKTRKLLRFGVDHEGKYDDMKPKQRMPSEESAPPHSILETRKNFSEPLNITEIEVTEV